MNESQDLSIQNESKPPTIVQQQRSLPNTLHTFPTLTRGNLKFRVRVIQYPKSERLLDIREYVTGPEFNGFSKKGITLDINQVRTLFENRELIIQALEDTL